MAEGLAGGFAAAFVLMFIVAVQLQREADARQRQPRPSLAFVSCGVTRNKVFGDDRMFAVAWVMVANETHSADPDAIANDVEAVVTYEDVRGQAVASGRGRWSHADQPSVVPLGHSVDHLASTKLLANGVPRTLEVAIHYDGDPVFSTFADTNYERFRSHGDPELFVQKLPNPTVVGVGLVGAGVVLKPREFVLSLGDDGLQFEERPRPSPSRPTSD